MRQAIRDVAAGKQDTVIECSNGEEAVEHFGSERPDLVLMDISMPLLDGIEAARAILAIDPAARIVMVSENDSEPFRKASFSAGASAFVSKNNLFDLESVIHGQ